MAKLCNIICLTMMAGPVAPALVRERGCDRLAQPKTILFPSESI